MGTVAKILAAVIKWALAHPAVVAAGEGLVKEEIHKRLS